MPTGRSARKILELFIILIGFIFPHRVQGQGPLYGEDIHLLIDVELRNVERVPRDQITGAKPLPGVSLTAWVYYTHYNETGFPVTEYKYSPLESNTAGTYSVTLNLGDAVFDIHSVGVEINNRDRWLLKYYGDQKITDTHYQIDLYVIPMIDDDGNGIRDDFEMALARQFCPSFQLNLDVTYTYPEPVNIMGGPNNTDIYVTMTDGESEAKERFSTPANLVSYRKPGRPLGTVIPENMFGKSWNYSEEFKENPVVLNYGDLLKWPKNDLNAALGFDYYLIDRKKYLWIHLNWPGGNVNDWWVAYKEEQDRTRNGTTQYLHTVYCTLWEVIAQGSPFNNYEIALQYWFFYPFDDWANDHEGDWEHINIIISEQFIERAYIKYTNFYFHEVWHEWDRNDLKIYDDTHIVVYVGGTFLADHPIPNAKDGHMSGASYPAPRTWRNVAGLLNDKAYGLGPYLHWSYITGEDDGELDGKGVEIMKDPNRLGFSFFQEHKEYSWLKANIFFGEPHNDPRMQWLSGFIIPHERKDIDATQGPYNHSGWRKLGNISGFEHYNP